MALLNLVGDNVLTGALASGATNSNPVLLGNGSGSFIIGVHTTAQSGTSPTLTVKAQECDDAATWTDMTGITTSALAGANQTAVVFGHSAKKYVRLVGTVGGSATPTITANVSIVGFGAV